MEDLQKPIAYGFLALALLVVGCDKDKKNQDPELVALCNAGVQAEWCLGFPPDDWDPQSYVDDCVEKRQPQAEAISDDCGNRHLELLACLEGKDCSDQLYYWFQGRLMDGDYVCNTETTAFRGACPGVWFAPE